MGEKRDLSFLEKFRKELNEDVKITRDRLKGDISQVTSLQAKWLNYYSIFKEVYIKESKKLKELKVQRYHAMINGHAGMAVTKTEASRLVNGDKDVVDLEEKIERLELALDFFSEAQKIVRDKSFAISNVIRLIEFEAGIS